MCTQTLCLFSLYDVHISLNVHMHLFEGNFNVEFVVIRLVTLTASPQDQSASQANLECSGGDGIVLFITSSLIDPLASGTRKYKAVTQMNAQ